MGGIRGTEELQRVGVGRWGGDAGMNAESVGGAGRMMGDAKGAMGGCGDAGGTAGGAGERMLGWGPTSGSESRDSLQAGKII